MRIHVLGQTVEGQRETYISVGSSSIFCLFVYFEKESMSRGGTERERGRTPSRLHTVSLEPDVGLEPLNLEIMT